MAQINNWRGGSIEVARSGGGVHAVVDPWNNVITTGIRPWPAPELIQKIYQSRQIRAFSGDDQQLAIHSEDAITWSVFGPVLYASAEVREAFVADLLGLIRVSGSPSNARVWLWRRLPHPDTPFPNLPYDEAAAEWHGGERARLESLGRPAPFVDGQIAAIAHVHGLVLVTTNDHDFVRFKGLRVENWSKRHVRSKAEPT